VIWTSSGKSPNNVIFPYSIGGSFPTPRPIASPHKFQGPLPLPQASRLSSEAPTPCRLPNPNPSKGLQPRFHMQDILEEQSSWVEQSTPKSTSVFHAIFPLLSSRHPTSPIGWENTASQQNTQFPCPQFHGSSTPKASWPLQTKNLRRNSFQCVSNSHGALRSIA
jgi:hypothetical protein